MLLANSNFKEKMLAFVVPNDLKDDLVYCQRSLRHFIKVHQLLVAKLSMGQTANQTLKIKKYMEEIESEVMEIGNEQKPLVQQLNKLMVRYFDRLTEEYVEIDKEIAHGYVSRLLSVHYELCFNTNYTPKNVTERLNEAQLLNKYELTSFEEYYLKLKDDNQTSGPSISPTTALNASQLQSLKQQVSLLKPREERVVKPLFTSITFSNAKAQVPTISPAQGAPQNIQRKVVQILPREKQPAGLDSGANTMKQSRINYQDDINIKATIIQKKIYITPVIPPTIAIKNSRINLLQALHKAKNRTLEPVVKKDKIPAKKSISSIIGSQKRSSTPSEAPSNNSSRSPTPISLRSSEDSDDGRKKKKYAEMPQIEDEIVTVQPTDISEMDQENFLKIFGLLTLDASQALVNRKTERKRRSVNSTERKDFHYGRLDLFERQFQQTQQKRKNKRPILYSPPANKVTKNPKYCANASSSSSSSSSLKPMMNAMAMVRQKIEASNIILAEVENKICIACSKTGSTDTLSACIFCCNFYHIRCHTGISNQELVRHRDNICPKCLRKKQRVAENAASRINVVVARRQ